MDVGLSDEEKTVRRVMLTSVYDMRARNGGLFRCKTCRHRFREVLDYDEFSWRIVKAVGRVDPEVACPDCSIRLRRLGHFGPACYDSGSRMPGVTDR